jgi:hypothetical protein
VHFQVPGVLGAFYLFPAGIAITDKFGGFMRIPMLAIVVLAFLAAAIPLPAPAQGPGTGIPQVTLPFDLVDDLDGVKFRPPDLAQ